MIVRSPGARPPSHLILTDQRARRPGPAPTPWEAMSLAMESGSGGGSCEAIRIVYYDIRSPAQCLQGTILAPIAARLPTAGSVAHGH
jgi:hypothetical protein